MREQYIKQVKKELRIPHKVKKGILRDLNEAFDSAAEHGETEQQVIQRLGPPKDLAENIEENAGFGHTAYRKKSNAVIEISVLCGIAVFSFAAALLSRRPAPSDTIIGQADAMTSITVKDSFPFSISAILLVIGFGAIVIALVRTVRFMGKKNNTSRRA